MYNLYNEVKQVVVDNSKTAGNASLRAAKAVGMETLMLSAVGTVYAADATAKAASFVACHANNGAFKLAQMIINRKK